MQKEPTVEPDVKPDGKKIKPTTKVRRPKTGDEMNVKTLLVVLVAAVVAVITIVIYRRKHK